MSQKLIQLVCPKCKRCQEVARTEQDFPDAARFDLPCPDCNPGDFAEPMYYDADGKHINRDPAEPEYLEIPRFLRKQND